MDSQSHHKEPAPPLVSIFILSAAVLAYEVLLVRLFSIIQWHHFAFMVISMALLGYGVSGSFITVFRNALIKKYNNALIINIILFGVSSIICFVVVQRLPFNTLEILWDSSQWQRLLLSYLLLTLPFFFVANVVALTMMRFHQNIPLVYGFDLIGAGVGAVSIMALLQMFSPDTALRLISISGIAAGFFSLAYFSCGKRQVIASTLIILMAAIYMLPQQWINLRISEYKGLEQTLLIKDVSLLESHTSPISQIDVVQSPFIPFRYAPGLSLHSPVGPPDQLAVFIDGDQMTTIDHVTDMNSFTYLNYTSSALPYYVRSTTRNILILGSATGTQISQAYFQGIPEIDAVEPDSQLSFLITDKYADYYGWERIKDRVTIHTMSPRGIANADKNYDLVVVDMPGASAGGAAGVYALSPSYDYTVEAIEAYLKLLAPDGLLSITMWTSNPARENLKLFATSVKAMKQSGIEHPEKNIAWIRSWNTATLLLKNEALMAEEISSVREFGRTRGFDIMWLPDIAVHEVNVYQRLQDPVFYLAAQSMLKDAGNGFAQEYKYDLQATTDDKPYFNNFFKWSSLKEVISLPGKSGLSMIGVGYPVLLVTLIQASIAAVVLILLPLVFVKKENRDSDERRKVFVYFVAIGLAFLFIELAFIQKFTLILSQPLYAVAVALCAFLVFSGLGSLYVQYRMRVRSSLIIPDLLRSSVLMIGFITVLYMIMFPIIIEHVMSWSENMRILSAFVIAAPLAFVMGMPFPLGLAALQQSSPRLMSWAWGINGCASVLSAILAVLLAIEIGFNGVMLFAVILYLIAWVSHSGSSQAIDKNNKG